MCMKYFGKRNKNWIEEKVMKFENQDAIASFLYDLISTIMEVESLPPSPRRQENTEWNLYPTLSLPPPCCEQNDETWFSVVFFDPKATLVHYCQLIQLRVGELSIEL